ncbi:S9 family peptidase [Pseudoalteromonas sp. SMS1]|uniref:S9 family peptidase n=1 Tax=Pseudoalteromonas sp. SMS1 TaxID=2908894 RepID=UPI001F2731F8|nr:S9 family peptidase [Pseudoalteromonas sp. SMS1]MCF2858385.1 S9 family peptidase [Pseudoalteromonas sp. SMS1]
MTKKIKSKKPLGCLLLSAVLMTASSGIFAHEQNQNGLVPQDYFDFVFMGDPQISPNNEVTLFVKTTVNEDASGRNSQIFKINKSGVISEFTQGKGDRGPQWSEDGRHVAFIRTVDEKAQVFVMPADGGEAKQVTTLDQSLTGFEWFPSGDKLLLTLSVSPKSAKTQKDVNGSGESNKRAEPNIVVVNQAKYIANGSGYLSDKRRHLFLFDMQKNELTQLTSGPDWNANSPVVSKDGKHIYFHANRTGLEYEGNTNSEIYHLDVKTQEITALTDHAGAQVSASLSRDNTLLSYVHYEDTYAQADLMLQGPNGQLQNLTADFDRNVSQAIWAPDNKTLYFTANDHGANRLFSVSRSGKVTKLMEQNTTIKNLVLSHDGQFLVFTMESATQLPELYRLNLDSKLVTKLTRFNDPVLADKRLSPAQEVWFTNEKGMRVQGFIHKPLNFDKHKSYPLVLNIKGGPGGMWGHQWFHENQMYAAKGYAVAYVNYRGSSGYGIAHSKAVRKDYGGADYRDNVQFLDKVLSDNKWVDAERLYITGGSHGGFLTNWITTKTDRFKAAVTQRSVSSWISEAGTQEYTPNQMTKEFGGNLWNNFDAYWDRSPLKYADKVSTPTLIIHSDADMITPLGQGQEWFYALKANDVPVEMVIFKGETHSLSRSGTPTNLVERLTRIIDWFERHQ